MKKWLTKFTVVLLTAAIILSGAVACGGENGEEYTPGTPDVPDNGYTADVTVDPDIPMCEHFGRPLYEMHQGELRPLTAGFTEVPMDLNGRVVSILTSQITAFTDWDDIDATPNETRHIMAQLRTIEQDYNMEFHFETRTHIGSGAANTGGMVEVLQAQILAGLHEFDMINFGGGGRPLDRTIGDNVLMDLERPDVAAIIDFENNPWHPNSYIAHMLDTLWGVHFITINSGRMLTQVLTFNRSMMESLLPEFNFYEMVHHGIWNISNFEGILRHIAVRSNNTVVPLSAHAEGAVGPGFILANGGAIIESHPEGLEFVGDVNERAIEAISRLAAWQREGLFQFIPLAHSGATRYEMMQHAAAGGIMFMSGEYGLLRTMTRQRNERGMLNSEFRFGLLPIPKGDHMDDYVASITGADMYHIVNHTPRAEEIAAILVAMANRISKLNIIEHERLVGVQDEESAEILAMLLERTKIDYSRTMRSGSATSTAVRLAINNQQATVQALQQQAPRITGELEEFNAGIFGLPPWDER